MTPSKFQASFSFLNSVKIRRVKEKLVSRNEGDIIEACDNLLKYFDNDCFVTEVLRSDIPVLLSEAVVPRAYKANSALYQCLRAFCNQKMFYRDGHVLVVLQAACRTGMFLMDDRMETEDGVPSELESVLLLLNDVLTGYEIFRISTRNLPIAELRSFLEALTNKAFTCINTRYQVAILLNTCLGNKDLKILDTNSKAFVENLIRYFEGIVNIAEFVNMSPEMDQIVDVACSLAHHLSKALNRLDENTQKIAEHVVVDFIVDHAVPHFMKIPLHQFENNSSGLVAMFLCIDAQLDGDVKKLSQQLVEAKLLSLVSTILGSAQNWENKVLENIAQKLLWRLLALVALDVFQFPSIWPEGREHFIHEVQSGVLAAPPDPSDWLAALADSTTHRSVKLVVVLFLYFYVLTEGSDVNTRAAVAQFIEHLNPIAPRVIFIKTIWLILAVSEVSADTETDQDDVVLKFSSLLDSLDDLDVVYTHHPTLLFHAMASSQFSTSLQHHVVRLWLNNQTEKDKSLFSEFLKTSNPGKCVTLNLIQTGNLELLENAFDAVKALLIDSEDDEVAVLVWRVLPIACTKMCGYAISSENFEKIAELALLRVPEIQDPFDQSRIVNLFPAAVASMDVPQLAVWRLAHRLLAHFIGENNFYVVTCFTQSESFVKKLLEGFTSNCSGTAEICFKIAAWLSNAQRREDIPGSGVKASTALTPILDQMRPSQDPCVRHAALLFIHEILEAKWDPPLCRITDSPETLTLRLLFSLLLGAAFVDKSDACYECLKAFLIYCEDDETLLTHFIRGANFLHFIMNSLPLLATSEVVADLVQFWLVVRKPILPNPRRMCVPFESTVIVLLAEKILLSFRPYLMPLVLQLINSNELIESELHEKLCKRLETPLTEPADEPTSESPLVEQPEPVLDFAAKPTLPKESPLENNINLLDEFQPPDFDDEKNIVITQTQHYDTTQSKFQLECTECIDLTESDCENSLREHNTQNSSLLTSQRRITRSRFLSQDLFEMDDLLRRK